MREKYPTDLTDKEWAFMEPLIPGEEKLGRPARYAKREITNAIFYMARSGCAWRMMPHDLPPWRICYYYLAKWKHVGGKESVIEPPVHIPPRFMLFDPGWSVVSLDFHGSVNLPW